jgi:hypothetical protein
MQRAKYYKEPRVYPYIKGSIEVCVWGWRERETKKKKNVCNYECKLDHMNKSIKIPQIK